MPPKRATKSTKKPGEIVKKETDKAVKAIENIQFNLKLLKMHCSTVEDYKERNSNMKRRSNHIAKIPNFWLNALRNSSEAGHLFTVDEKFFEIDTDKKDLAPSPLHHFTALEVGFFRKPKIGFKLSFNFDERTNPFFQNKVITKEYIMNRSENYACKTNTVKWYLEYQKLLDEKNLDGKSFMAWVTDNNDDSYGEEIRDKIWSNPLKYFLNQKNKSDDEDSDCDLEPSKYELGFGRYGTTWNEWME